MGNGDRNGPSTRKASNLFCSIAIKNLHKDSAENGGMQSKDCADFIAFSHSVSAKAENYHSLNDNKRLPSISVVAIHVIAWTLHKQCCTFSPSSSAANANHRRTRNDNIFHWKFNFIVRQKIVIKIVINFFPMYIQHRSIKCLYDVLFVVFTVHRFAYVVSHSFACSLYDCNCDSSFDKCELYEAKHWPWLCSMIASYINLTCIVRCAFAGSTYFSFDAI